MKTMILKYFEKKTRQMDRLLFSNLLRLDSILRRLFFLVLTALILPLSGFAQASPSASLTVSANVVPALSIAEDGTLNFGTAYPGYPVAAVNPKTASSIPLFTIEGEPSKSISLTLPASGSLSLNSTSITFSPIVIGGQTDDLGSSNSLSPGTITEDLSPTNGDYFLWLGGHVNNDNPLPNLSSGVYTGTYTVQVDY